MLVALLSLLQGAIVASEEPTSRSVAIYNDIAFVREERIVEVPAGSSTIVFKGVSDALIPQTVVLQSFEGVTLERNFDSDLLSPKTLFSSSVGERVLVSRLSPGGAQQQQTVTVVSAHRGLVVKTDEGLEALDCSGLPEGVALPRRPAGLVSRPQLSIQVQADKAGEKRLSIGYLIAGLTWNADYGLTLNEEETSAHLFGWLTMEKETNTAFAKSPVVVIAGRPAIDDETVRVGPRRTSFQERFPTFCWPQGKTSGPFRMRRVLPYQAPPVPTLEPVMMLAESASMRYQDTAVSTAKLAAQENFADYKLFRAPEAVSLNPYQTKQLAFLDVAEVKVEKVYGFELGAPQGWPNGATEQRKAVVRYDIDNSREGALARALPEGTIRVFAPSKEDGPLFYGEDQVDNLAVDLPGEVRTGPSAAVLMDLTSSIAAVRDEVRTSGETTYNLTATLTNAASREAVAEMSMEEAFKAYINQAGRVVVVEILSESHPRMPNKPFPTWRVAIPAEGIASRSWQVRVLWSDRGN